jgi:acetyl esterase/lipase
MPTLWNLTAAALLCALTGGALTAAPKPFTEIPLWPAGVPGEQAPVAAETEVPARPGQKQVIRLTNVSQPSILVYRPANPKPGGTAVVIAPGGGYSILAWDLEGTEVAEWLNTLGVTAVVLKYRVPKRAHDPQHLLPLQDAQRAIRLVRQNASKWALRPDRIGILGFSAGGHLTVMAATHWKASAYTRVDDADDLSARPDFAIPIYPAYLNDPAELQITPETPPAFIAVTWDDQTRGADAAIAFAEWRKHKVPAELHVFSKGGHGYGLRPSADPVSGWPRLCADWLRVSGFIESTQSQ